MREVLNRELPRDQGLFNMFINYLGLEFPDFVNGCWEGSVSHPRRQRDLHSLEESSEWEM
jgi:hypothetical protein